MLTTLPLLNPNWLSLGFFKSSERSSWRNIPRNRQSSSKFHLPQIKPQTKPNIPFTTVPVLLWASCIHWICVTCYREQVLMPATGTERWLWASVGFSRTTTERKCLLSHLMDEGTEGRELTQQAQGHGAGEGNPSLQVSSSVFFWQYPLFPSLPSIWFLWLHPFCLGLLHVGGDRHPRLRAPLPLSRAVYVLWLLILHWEAQESSC